MQVTPSNTLFAALSAQIQSLQQNSQTQSSKHAGGDKFSPGSRLAGSPAPGSATVLNGTGQVETGGVTPNLNLREAPGAGRHGAPAFTPLGSVIDITV